MTTDNDTIMQARIDLARQWVRAVECDLADAGKPELWATREDQAEAHRRAVAEMSRAAAELAAARTR